MFYEGGKAIGLLPAAVVDRDGERWLVSPYGASVGGLVVASDCRLLRMIGLVASLTTYAKNTGLHGIELRIGPSIFLREPNALQPFALQTRGFELSHCGLTFVLTLQEASASLSGNRRRERARAERDNAFEPRELGEESLGAFYAILTETMDRHVARPTHTLSELADLYRRVPGKLRLFLLRRDEVELAGILVFVLNSVAAYTFYLCSTAEGLRHSALVVLLQFVVDTMRDEGFRYLDLGPSASDTHINEGVVFFKESLGAQGFRRETWQWRARA